MCVRVEVQAVVLTRIVRAGLTEKMRLKQRVKGDQEVAKGISGERRF